MSCPNDCKRWSRTDDWPGHQSQALRLQRVSDEKKDKVNDQDTGSPYPFVKQAREGKSFHGHLLTDAILMSPLGSPTILPRLSGTLRQCFSKLYEARGPLCTNIEGSLVDEESGDWIVLDTSS
ncbi:hypothetical protein BKA66DRAFT_446219 [Pyrenochaeta sp. MPI-SDFR-AT-0127]|nr:hypothetical protein BKA66DRAFT_446219 [Pyrenochaeta sp. MPI-SDFR-AT-0127]